MVETYIDITRKNAREHAEFEQYCVDAGLHPDSCCPDNDGYPSLCGRGAECNPDNGYPYKQCSDPSGDSCDTSYEESSCGLNYSPNIYVPMAE